MKPVPAIVQGEHDQTLAKVREKYSALREAQDEAAAQRIARDRARLDVAEQRRLLKAAQRKLADLRRGGR